MSFLAHLSLILSLQGTIPDPCPKTISVTLTPQIREKPLLQKDQGKSQKDQVSKAKPEIPKEKPKPKPEKTVKTESKKPKPLEPQEKPSRKAKDVSPSPSPKGKPRGGNPQGDKAKTPDPVPWKDLSGQGASRPGEILEEKDVTVLRKKDPVYPILSRKRKEEGNVIVILTVETGKVVKAEVERTSGHAGLDEAALKGLRGWAFSEDFSGKVRIPVAFKLKRN